MTTHDYTDPTPNAIPAKLAPRSTPHPYMQGGYMVCREGVGRGSVHDQVRATVRLQIRLCDRFVLGVNPKTISHTNDRNELSSCG